MQARVSRGVCGLVVGRAFYVSSLLLLHGSRGHFLGRGSKAFPPKSSTTEQRSGMRVFESGPGEAGDSKVSTEAFVRLGWGKEKQQRSSNRVGGGRRHLEGH